MIDDDHRVLLEPISGGVNCEHEYINASYIDVRPSTQYTIRIYHWYSSYYVHLTHRAILNAGSSLPPRVS